MKKQILLIGNASTLSDTNFGKTIDSYDCVVRFNKFDLSNIYKKDYGEKINIWIVNGYEYKNLPKSHKHNTNIEQIYISSTTKNVNDIKKYLKMKEANKYYFFDKTYNEDVKIKINYPKKFNISLGLFSIIHFIEQGYDVFITNMNHTPTHYFENVNPKLGQNHNWKFEKDYIKNMVNTNIISEIYP